MKVELKETVTVARSLSECFGYVKDFSTIEQWDPGVYRSYKLTPGAVREGSRFKLLLNIGGKHVPMVYTLSHCSDNDKVQLVGENNTLHALDTISFRAVDAEHTEICYHAVLTMHSLPQYLRPIMMPAMNRLGKKAVRGLQIALTVGAPVNRSSLATTLKDKLIVPSVLGFGERGYLAMPNKGLSQYLTGKTVLISGPTAGLGHAAACELSRLGARLLLVGRDQSKLEATRQAIADFSGADPATIELYEAELSLVADVKRVAGRIAARHERLDVLINNAGVLPLKRQLTSEGHELALAVNLLAPVALTEALELPLTRARGRVINVVSGGMYLAALRLDDMEFERSAYDGARAYARAKRALFASTEQMALHWRPRGVNFYAMHPGWAATPGVAKSLPTFNAKLKDRLRDARMGADTMVWLASAAEAEDSSGKLWFDRRVHTDSVLPGTAVTIEQKIALKRWLKACFEAESISPGSERALLS